MNTITAALAAAAIAAPIAAAEPMSYIADNRLLVAYGAQRSGSDQFSEASERLRPFAAFTDWNQNAGAGTGSALGFATIDSALTGTSIDAVGFASAAALFPADTLNYASALGASLHEISFAISDTTTFALQATLTADTPGASSIRLTDNALGAGAIIYQAINTDGTSTVDQQFTLGAGQYTLAFQAQTAITLTSPGNASGSARYDANWTIVPAPATTLIPLMGLAATMRRRR